MAADASTAIPPAAASSVALTTPPLIVQVITKVAAVVRETLSVLECC